MSDKEARTPEVVEDHTPAPQDPSQVLSPRRRTAVVTYMAILFAVAFLLVAVVMVLETSRLKTMNEELKDTNQRTSASLTGNINALQAENQKISKENEALTARVAELETLAEENETSLADLRTRVGRLENEKKGLEKVKNDLTIRVNELKGQIQQAIDVSELLQQAIAAAEDGDTDALKESLKRIEALKDLLSPTEKDIYESLIID